MRNQCFRAHPLNIIHTFMSVGSIFDETRHRTNMTHDKFDSLDRLINSINTKPDIILHLDIQYMYIVYVYTVYYESSWLTGPV